MGFFNSLLSLGHHFRLLRQQQALLIGKVAGHTPTTAQHASFGQPVSCQTLFAGDYLGNATFLHASTSSGVPLSRLDVNYWREHFWHAWQVLVH